MNMLPAAGAALVAVFWLLVYLGDKVLSVCNFPSSFCARLESLPCAADFSAAHFKFQPRFQPRNFR